MAEMNPVWFDRVRRAQQLAAARLGVDVNAMLPPRDGGTGEAGEPAPTTETASPQPEPPVVAAAEAPRPSPQPEPAAVAEAAPVAAAEVTPSEETPAEDGPATIEAQTLTAVQTNGSAAAADRVDSRRSRSRPRILRNRPRRHQPAGIHIICLGRCPEPSDPGKRPRHLPVHVSSLPRRRVRRQVPTRRSNRTSADRHRSGRQCHRQILAHQHR